MKLNIIFRLVFLLNFTVLGRKLVESSNTNVSTSLNSEVMLPNDEYRSIVKTATKQILNRVSASQQNLENYLRNIVSASQQKLENDLRNINSNLLGKLDSLEKSIFEVTKLINETKDLQNLEKVKVQEEINLGKIDGECGGISVASYGIISFNYLDTRLGQVTCIWTIRANEFSQVGFRLLSDQLTNGSILSLSQLSLSFTESNNAIFKDKTTYLKTLDRQEYILAGPVVFLTLSYNASANVHPRFELLYQGKKPIESIKKSYKHFHFTEMNGVVTYPTEKTANEYSPNEIVTFVVNPFINYKPLEVQLLHADIESAPKCSYDSLTFIHLLHQTYYSRRGRANSDYRFCSTHKNN